MTQYPSKCPNCKADIPEPYGMNLFKSNQDGCLICLKCMYKETINANRRKIRELEREIVEMESEL
jgi:hypothetical protein